MKTKYKYTVRETLKEYLKSQNDFAQFSYLIDMLQEKVKVKWKPNRNDKVFYISILGEIDYLYWDNLSEDKQKFMLIQKNYFKTEKQAEEYKEKLLSLGK